MRVYNLFVRKGWVVFFLVLQAAVLFSASAAVSPIASTQIDTQVRATLTRDYGIEVTVQPHKGDAWTRLARRLTGDASNWEDLAAHNQADENLKSDRPIRVPFALLRPALQREIIRTLFPLDEMTPRGWKHVVVGARGIEGESLWNIAEWLTGDGANYTLILKANPDQGL